MRLRIFLFIAILSLVLVNLPSLVLADFSLGAENYSYYIERDYTASENLKGWINISLDNEPADSLLKISGDGSEGNISLLSFLEDINFLAEGYDFSCIPINCEKDYSLSEEETSKTINVFSGDSKLIGFKVEGIITGINSLKFNLDSTATKSCLVPLKLDVGDDESIDWEFNKASNDFTCQALRGSCFESSFQEIKLDEKLRCEKVNLIKKPAYKIGAWIRKNGTSNIKAYLYSVDDLIKIDECSLDNNKISESGGEVGCEIYPDLEAGGEYFICINAESASNYTIQFEQTGEKCGFYDIDIFSGNSVYTSDYNVFAKPVKYAEINKFEFNNSVFLDFNPEAIETLEEYIFDYLINKYDDGYGNANCSDYCVIPVKIIASGPTQQVEISDVDLDYNTNIESNKKTNKVYVLSEVAAKISSSGEYLKLDLDDADLKVSPSYGTKYISLQLGNRNIFSNEEIDVSRGSMINSVYPLNIAAGVPTKFYADVVTTDNKSIISYEWDFDGDLQTTTENEVEYSFLDIGNYNLILTIEDEDGRTFSKEFTINVGSPKNIANETLKKYRENIENIKSNISSFPNWYKSFVENVVGINDLDSDLINIEKDFSIASTSDDYIDVMVDLVQLNVPNEIRTKTGSIPKLALPEDIDLDALSELGAGDYGNIDYEDAVASWFNTKIDADLDYNIISLVYDSGEEEVVSVFTIKLKPKEDIREGYFIIEEDLSGGRFKQDYHERDLSGKTGIVLDSLTKDSEEKFEFAVEYIDPEELVFYLSPRFSDLEAGVIGVCNFNSICEKDLNENYKNCRADCKPWGWVIFWFVLIIIFALIIYIILQQWYKRNYEKSLFKNRNELFNLVNFINSAKLKGLEDKEIKEKLKQVKWSKEQINYAMKKAKGKFVGMKELPFIRFFKGKLKKQVPSSTTPKPGFLLPKSSNLNNLKGNKI